MSFKLLLTLTNYVFSVWKSVLVSLGEKKRFVLPPNIFGSTISDTRLKSLKKIKINNDLNIDPCETRRLYICKGCAFVIKTDRLFTVI